MCGFPSSDNPPSENRTQLNTNKLNTNIPPISPKGESAGGDKNKIKPPNEFEEDFDLWWNINREHKRTEDPKAACKKKYIAARKSGLSREELLAFAEAHVAKNRTLKKKLGFRGALEIDNIKETLLEGKPQELDLWGDPVKDSNIIDAEVVTSGELPQLLPPKDDTFPW